MIATLQAENAKISATLRVHDQLVQALRLRIAKLQKLAFGKSSEKIEREIEQLELALEDLLVTVAEDDDAPIDEGQDEPIPEEPSAPALRRRPRVSDATLRERRELDPGTCCPDCGGDLRVVGEDVSELLDMIAAQMKVIYYPAVAACSDERADRSHQEILPSLRKDGAGARTQPSDPGQHGRPKLAGACAGVEVRRSPSPLSPTRDLRAYGGRHPRKYARRLVRSGHENSVTSDRADRRGHHGERSVACPLSADCFAIACRAMDDTPIRVLDRSMRDKGLGKGVRQGRIWVYVRDQRPWAGASPPGAVYRFAPNWKEEHVLDHLADARGILQAPSHGLQANHCRAMDGYKGYAKLYAPGPDRHAACPSSGFLAPKGA